MYKYRLTKISLLDVVSRITHIELCDDIAEYSSTSMAVAAAEGIDSQYLSVDDQDLLSLSPETIHDFQDIDLLLRVGKLNPELLSRDQQRKLRNDLQVKHTDKVTDQDIENLLILINKCNSVSYDFHHNKTNEFGLDSEGQLRARMILRILRKLTVNDWKYATRSVNWNHLGNTLFVFKPRLDYVDKAGMHHNQVELYIKLDVDETTKSAVALVAMHD